MRLKNYDLCDIYGGNEDYFSNYKLFTNTPAMMEQDQNSRFEFSL